MSENAKYRLFAYTAALVLMAAFAAAYLPFLNSIADGISIGPAECAK